MIHYDAVILGAGAAGLMAAITASSRGRSVLVIEKSNKVGKKILMSGGGRCNFTNTAIEFDNYISNNPHFCKSALSRYTAIDFIELVKKHKIEYEERKHNQLFCIHSAKDILNMLLEECELSGVQIKKDTEVKLLSPLKPSSEKSSYLIECSAEGGNKKEILQVRCESLVVATGALSIPTLGGSDFGYQLAEQFNLPLISPRAGLVPFMFTDSIQSIFASLSGTSVDVVVSCQNKAFREGLLFTHRGLSGPAILQISNYWNPGQNIVLDLLPDFNAAEVFLEEKLKKNKTFIKNFLSPFLTKSLISELQKIWWSDVAETSIQDVSNEELKRIGFLLNAWSLKPSSTEGYRTAEVTLGGVDTSSISSKTMETNNQPGLYFIGEVLDVTGHLGGYNFQWAWSSGYCAGLVI